MPPSGRGPAPHYCMDNYLDLPRIPIAPMDLVLVLEFLLDQLPCRGLDALIKESTWAGLVKRSEQFWLLPYHRGSARFLGSGEVEKSHYEFQKSFGPAS